MTADQLAVNPAALTAVAALVAGAKVRVMVLIVDELAEVPDALIARTLYWYDVPAESPLMVTEVPETGRLL